jgi:hypothetical protein
MDGQLLLASRALSARKPRRGTPIARPVTAQRIKRSGAMGRRLSRGKPSSHWSPGHRLQRLWSDPNSRCALGISKD